MTELDQYNYELPDDLVAQFPAPERVDARLLVVDRARDRIDHRHIRDLPQILDAGDCLALNNSKVVPARLLGKRSSTGGRWEGLYLKSDGPHWMLLCKCRGSLTPGERITLQNRRGVDDVELKLVGKIAGGGWLAALPEGEETLALLDRVGRVPLPRYIRGSQQVDSDVERYQTVFAREPGSAAAPTAGLHFTLNLLRELRETGVGLAETTLHVGLDTFQPIRSESLAEHKMHSEYCVVDEKAIERMAAARAAGGRVVAVGTTVVRTLETAAADGEMRPFAGETDLFIRPGYEFRAVDAMLTNFHLPRTTLLVLVRTFGGDELIARAYEEAVAQRYRFYSYGDAMLIL